MLNIFYNSKDSNHKVTYVDKIYIKFNYFFRILTIEWSA